MPFAQFSTLEPEITCRLVYVKDVQISGGGSADDALQQQQHQQQQPGGAKPNNSQRELPTCPVCLERLDEPTSGVVTTVRILRAPKALMQPCLWQRTWPIASCA